jgi:lysophospholipase L1-like esterase
VRGYRWCLTALGFAGVLAFGSASFSSCIPRASNEPPPPTRYYLSMGASLSTGSGVPAGQGYVDAIRTHEDARLPLVTVRLGCFGETTNSMIRGGHCTYTHGSQLAEAEAFLSLHPGQVGFITMEIGANDITPCFSASGVDQACAQAAIDGAATNLTIILRRLRTAGGAVPIFGMTYYDPFLAYWASGNENAATQSEQAAVAGNATIAGVYLAAEAQVADIGTAFDTSNFAMTGSYNGTTVPQNVANICAWTLMCSAGNIHANADGYSLIAKSFESLIDATVSP